MLNMPKDTKPMADLKKRIVSTYWFHVCSILNKSPFVFAIVTFVLVRCLCLILLFVFLAYLCNELKSLSFMH